MERPAGSQETTETILKAISADLHSLKQKVDATKADSAIVSAWAAHTGEHQELERKFTALKDGGYALDGEDLGEVQKQAEGLQRKVQDTKRIVSLPDREAVPVRNAGETTKQQARKLIQAIDIAREKRINDQTGTPQDSIDSALAAHARQAAIIENSLNRTDDETLRKAQDAMAALRKNLEDDGKKYPEMRVALPEAGSVPTAGPATISELPPEDIAKRKDALQKGLKMTKGNEISVIRALARVDQKATDKISDTEGGDSQMSDFLMESAKLRREAEQSFPKWTATINAALAKPEDKVAYAQATKAVLDMDGFKARVAELHTRVVGRPPQEAREQAPAPAERQGQLKTYLAQAKDLLVKAGNEKEFVDSAAPLITEIEGLMKKPSLTEQEVANFKKKVDTFAKEAKVGQKEIPVLQAVTRPAEGGTVEKPFSDLKKITTAFIRDSGPRLEPVIDKYKSYDLGQWREINRAIATALGYKNDGDTDSMDFARMIQATVGIRNPDGKIGPVTLEALGGSVGVEDVRIRRTGKKWTESKKA